MLCIGDDRSDEDMFESTTTKAEMEALSPEPKVYACTVGQKPSKATYYLDDPKDVIQLLKELVAVGSESRCSKEAPLETTQVGSEGICEMQNMEVGEAEE